MGNSIKNITISGTYSPPAANSAKKIHELRATLLLDFVKKFGVTNIDIIDQIINICEMSQKKIMDMFM